MDGRRRDDALFAESAKRLSIVQPRCRSDRGKNLAFPFAGFPFEFPLKGIAETEHVIIVEAIEPIIRARASPPSRFRFPSRRSERAAPRMRRRRRSRSSTTTTTTTT
jgi:hypothetical protein